MGPLDELRKAVCLAEDAVAYARGALDALAPGDPDALIGCWLVLVRVTQAAKEVREELESLVGESMPDKRHTAHGVTVERTRPPARRTDWDSESLLRLVVDSRVVDPDTGEIESTLAVLRKVYGLAGYQARITALRSLGIDPDEFAKTEYRKGWTLRTWGGDT